MNADHLSLFDQMDLTADAASALPGYDICDNELIFRKLQKTRMPDLSPEQFQTLYQEWLERYVGRAKLQSAQAVKDIIAVAEEFAKHNPPAPPFRCICGAESKDPLDPAWMSIHQPHVQAAGEQRIRKQRASR